MRFAMMNQRTHGHGASPAIAAQQMKLFEMNNHGVGMQGAPIVAFAQPGMQPGAPSIPSSNNFMNRKKINTQQ